MTRCLFAYEFKSHFWKSSLLTITSFVIGPHLPGCSKKIREKRKGVQVFFLFEMRLSVGVSISPRSPLKGQIGLEEFMLVMPDYHLHDCMICLTSPLPPPPLSNTLIPSALSYNCGNNGSWERGAPYTWFGQNGEFLLILQTCQTTYSIYMYR